MQKLPQGYTANDFIAVGITNQRESICVWDRDRGDPFCKVILWNDGRAAEVCHQIIKEQGGTTSAVACLFRHLVDARFVNRQRLFSRSLWLASGIIFLSAKVEMVA